MKQLSVMLLLCLVFSALSCGGGGGDPLDPGGGNNLGPGASMANAKVDSSNQYVAFQAFHEEITGTFAKAIRTVSSSAGNPPFRFVGAGNGACVVTENDTTIHSGIGYASNLALTYENYYSDSGKLFCIGSLNVQGVWNVGTGNTIFPSTCFVSGTISFSGEYACSITFDHYSIIMQNGVPRNLPTMVAEGPTCILPYDGSMTLTNKDGSKLFGSPYSFDRVGCN